MLSVEERDVEQSRKAKLHNAQLSKGRCYEVSHAKIQVMHRIVPRAALCSWPTPMYNTGGASYCFAACHDYLDDLERVDSKENSFE